MTLFGQSAGGLSVCTIVASPLAAGLIKHAVIQSGSCTGAWGPGSREYGLAATRAMMEHLKVTTLAELRALPAANLSWPHSWPNTRAAEVRHPHLNLTSSHPHPHIILTSSSSSSPHLVTVMDTVQGLRRRPARSG